MSVSCFKYVKSYQILTECKSTIIIIANIKQIGKKPSFMLFLSITA